MLQARPGFTILETLAALAILSVALTGAAVMMTSAFGTYRHQDRTLDRHRLVHDRMETLSATPYGELKADIEGARKPDDPPKGDPIHDFESVSGGEAVARYGLKPPHDGHEDWEPVPKRKSSVVLHTSGQSRQVEATLRLQYWDPEFDSPSLTDRGLIRATFSLAGQGAKNQATKYLAR